MFFELTLTDNFDRRVFSLFGCLGGKRRKSIKEGSPCAVRYKAILRWPRAGVMIHPFFFFLISYLALFIGSRVRHV